MKVLTDKINKNMEALITAIVIINFVSGGIIFPIITFLEWNNKYPYNVISIGIIVLFMITLLVIFVYGAYLENIDRAKLNNQNGKE